MVACTMHTRNCKSWPATVVFPSVATSTILLMIACSAVSVASSSLSSSPFLRVFNRNPVHLSIDSPLLAQRQQLTQLLFLRGGGTKASSTSSSTKSTTKKKKKKGTTGKKKKKKETSETEDEPKEEAKDAIENAMRKDGAEALGDAIRDRADTLREEDPFLQGIDWSLSSLGHAVGASDARMMMNATKATQQQDDTDGGGVEAAPTSVIANYFLKSHGGAHAVQCACSLLATMSGMGVLLFNKHNPMLCATLLRRTLLFAMIKHVSGLIAAASLAAKSIPEIGLSQARVWMEQLAHDPVSQYVFYTSVMLIWLPSSRQALVSCWWFTKFLIPAILIGPVLLREVVSTLLVVSDVMVLWSYGGTTDNEDEEGTSAGGGSNELIRTKILPIAQATIDAVMSLFVSPSVWRAATPAKRQEILAKSISKLSLILEVLIGLVLACDAGLISTQLLFGAGKNSKRPSLKVILQRLICVRLYSHFLWVRRKNISKLAVKIRGGAADVPFWFLNIVLDPSGSMGLTSPEKTTGSTNDPSSTTTIPLSTKATAASTVTWKDYMLAAVGLDD